MFLRTITIIGMFILPPVFFLGCAGGTAMTTTENTNSRALRDMGASLVNQGNLRAGLEYLLKAVEQDPRNPGLNHELAIVYRDLGEYNLSLTYFKKALALKRDFPEAQNNLGTLYLLRGECDSAIESFQTAVDNLLYQTPHIAYSNMGLAYYNKGQYEKAIESYLMALKEFPGYAPCHVNLGIAYQALNRIGEAISAYDNSIRYDPEYAPAYYRLGKLYYETGQKGDSLSALEKFISLANEGDVVEEAKNLVRSINQSNFPQ